MGGSIITRLSAAACTALLLASTAAATASAHPAAAAPASVDVSTESTTESTEDASDADNWAETQAALDYATRSTEPVVERSEDGSQVVVSFSDTVDSVGYRYTFERDADSQADDAEDLDGRGTGPAYTWTRSGWVPNRAGTDELSRDGATWAGLYGIAATLGAGFPAVVGAAVEGRRASHAASCYGHGDCAKICYWPGITEVGYGSRGCR